MKKLTLKLRIRTDRRYRIALDILDKGIGCDEGCPWFGNCPVGPDYNCRKAFAAYITEQAK